MLGDSRLAVEFAHEMLLKGIYVIGFTFPVVPKGNRDVSKADFPGEGHLLLQVRPALECRCRQFIVQRTWNVVLRLLSR